MSRSRMLSRIAVVGAAVALLAAGVAALVLPGSGLPLALLAAGALGVLALYLLDRRAALRSRRVVLRKLDALPAAILQTFEAPGTGPASRANHLLDLHDLLTETKRDMGDTAALIAASESILLAELLTVRQKVEASARDVLHVSTHYKWIEGQFKQLRGELQQLPSQTGEYAAIRSDLAPERTAMPVLGGWVLSAPTLTWLVQRLRSDASIKTVVELGSGASTLWFALALQERNEGHIISVDHLADYAEQTRESLAAHGLSDRATVVHAPLVPLEMPDQSVQWYDPDCLPETGPIDLIVVDGPPNDTGPQARFPALPMLAGRLRPGALICVDDTVVAGIKDMLAEWRTSYPNLTTLVQLPKSVILRWDEPNPDVVA